MDDRKKECRPKDKSSAFATCVLAQESHWLLAFLILSGETRSLGVDGNPRISGTARFRTADSPGNKHADCEG